MERVVSRNTVIKVPINQITRSRTRYYQSRQPPHTWQYYPSISLTDDELPLNLQAYFKQTLRTENANNNWIILGASEMFSTGIPRYAKAIRPIKTVRMVKIHNRKLYSPYFTCKSRWLVPESQKSLTLYRVFRAQADWTLTHTSHKDTEQSTIEASITLDGVTLTDSLIRWSPNEWPSVCRAIPQCLPIRCSGRLISLHSEHSI
jgi:hypothetical protein